MRSKLSFLSNEKEYPRVYRRLQLREYHAELKGDYLDIWVNWSREFNDRIRDWNEKLLRAQMGADKGVQTILDKVESALAPTEFLLLKAMIPRGKAATERLVETAQEGFAINAELWGCEEENVEAIWHVDIDLWTWINTRAAKFRAKYQEDRKKADGGTLAT